ncbi:hypothetical protein FRUB_08838 [Fimbriiglobus ruber]|uniref:Uncharacterized protein n=1 Tax=Fimbriiglobus ruber TaxID=1908690 RepID=A0A225DIS6_9BACT|nr:hypothetical protein FRUB_08838 [Fimbriiglobus ruber]
MKNESSSHQVVTSSGRRQPSGGGTSFEPQWAPYNSPDMNSGDTGGPTAPLPRVPVFAT